MAKDGCQINLDLGLTSDGNGGKILSGEIIDDFRACCTFLHIIFECDEKCVFGADNGYYFTYSGMDWVPCSLNETRTVNKTWHYDLCCYPVHMFDVISKPVKNTQELARSMKLNLSSLSPSLPIICPTINQHAGNFIQDARLHSLEKNYVEGRIGDACFIYFRSQELLSMKWRTIVSQTATVMEFPESLSGSNLITYMDDQFENVLTTAHGAIPWSQNDYLVKLLGTSFKIETAVPALFLNVYTMSFKDIPEFDTGLPFLCIYSKWDIVNPNAYTHVFANIQYME